MPGSTSSQPPKLLDQVRQVLRLHHDAIHTQRAYLEWIVRYVRFHGMRSRRDLFPAEPKSESCLTDLAVHGHAAAATQNQAMHALLSSTSASSTTPWRVAAMPCAPTRRSMSPWS